MLKPLLRTIPTLSGNVTLSCKLNEIIKDSNNEYHAYVRVASLSPLQNSMFKKNIELNLLNGKYEYDIVKFYKIYSNVFYKENFSYNKKNYVSLDLYNTYENINSSRNKDYEFGCKRIMYSSSGYQFNFYAPIYIDNINDIPSYFCIHLRFNENFEKIIKVYINDDEHTNYLGEYLKRYVKKIDDRVIFCLTDSLQATYFGIDVRNGGLVQYKDNEIGALYINQTTINNFDYIICKGFSRNTLIMSQIIPLSFSFNINDILTEYEKEFFMCSKVTIYGYYCTDDNTQYPFYDFDIDYTNPYYKYLKYDEETGKYNYLFGKTEEGNKINIMNSNWPALNESKYIKYAYTNKITPMYCKFKMMLSSDYDPYITNLNFGYTSIQTPNQKYGYFPTMFKGIYPHAYVDNKDLKLPIGHNKETYYKTLRYYANNVQINTTNIDKYIKLMSNYYGSWYTINNEFNIDIFDNASIWSDVKYNYTYYKGILYNLRELSKYNIDKFGVLLNANLKYINENNALNKIIKASLILSKTDESPYNISNYNDSYDMQKTNNEIIYYDKIYNISSAILNNYYALIDKYVIEDPKGKYIEETYYDDENVYYKYDDVLALIMKYANNSNVINELDNKKVLGYLLLDAANNKNYFESYNNVYGEECHRFMLTNEFNSKKQNNNLQVLLNSLYYIDSRYSFRKHVKDIFETIDSDSDLYGKFRLLQEISFIHINDIYNILIDNYPQKLNTILMYLNDYQKYNYNQYGDENGLVIKDYFTKTKLNDTEIYVDPYNLNELISLYNVNNSEKIDKILPSDKTLEMFIKIINKDHLKEYVKKLNNDENNYSLIKFKSLLNCLYVKKRYWTIDNQYIEPVDIYYTLDEFIRNYILYYDKKYIDGTEEYTDEYKELLKYANEYNTISTTYENIDILEWICSNMSDSRNSSDKFILSIFNINMEIDLCVKKEMIILNDKIMKILVNNDNTIKNFLYLFIKDPCKTDNNDIWSILNKSELNDKIYKNINDYLVPLFTSPYINDFDINTLYNMISRKKINNYRYIYNNGKYFKEIDIINTVISLSDLNKINKLNKLIESNNLSLKWYQYAVNKGEEDLDMYMLANNIINNDTDINLIQKYIKEKIQFIYNEDLDIFYKYVNMLNITLYSIYDIMDIKYNVIDNAIEGLIYDSDYNIYIYNHKGTIYGFYYINFNIDNTNNSFNILNDYNTVVHIESIDGKSIKTYDKKYFDNIFYLIQPLLKKNIFTEFTKTVYTIVYPYEAEINVKYTSVKANETQIKQYHMLKESEDDILYNEIVKLNNEKKIKLLRYFNYITPYIKETNIIKNSWELKFMKPNNFENIDKYSIYVKNDLNIYKYNGISVYGGIYDKNLLEFNEYELLNQYEYKYFNDSVLYNLPEEIVINDKKLYSSTYINKFNDKQFLENTKKQILLKYFTKKKLDYKNIILFLYNKYNSSVYFEKTKLSTNKNEYKYKISYKFTLI